MDNSHSSFIKASQEDSIVTSSQLSKKLFSIIKECPICKNKLKYKIGEVTTLTPVDHISSFQSNYNNRPHRKMKEILILL